MTIQSRFKDYYDHVGQIYGQDPSVIYVRKPFLQTYFELEEANQIPDLSRAFYHQSRRHGRWDRRKSLLPYFFVRFVFAGPHIFPLVFEGNYSTAVHVSLEEFKARFYSQIPGNYERRQFDCLFQPNVGVSDRARDAILRRVGAPVFTVRSPHEVIDNRGLSSGSYVRTYTFNIESAVPVLANWGIASLVSPEQMWQGIYHTLSNVLRENPDKVPPVELGDKMKIQKAGFDLRTSFRGK